MERIEQIVLATLELASEKGLGNVSLQMIADKVGIRKASLFNHIESKDDLIEKMYDYLRTSSKNNTSMISIDYEKSLEDILYDCYKNYISMCKDPSLNMFYKIIYSERAFNANATKIVIEETEKMIHSIKDLFIKLEQMGKMKNVNIDIDSIEFALTIHGFVDYEIDCTYFEAIPKIKALDYIKAFCRRH